jgi:hypothetical protein
MVTGLIIFLAGGAALAFGEGTTSTAIGTTLGLTGLLVAGWGWLGAGGRKA